ncbi:MAG: MFS transporter [Candidatus Bipolaricaulis sp.]|nr:MFS transporter [Candidatus Bipolaricaulis sp.]
MLCRLMEESANDAVDDQTRNPTSRRACSAPPPPGPNPAMVPSSAGGGEPSSRLESSLEEGYPSAIVDALGESPGRPVRRATVPPLAAASVLLAAASGGLEILVQLFLQARGAPTILISSVSSLASVGVVLGSLFWGRLSDRLGRRGLLIVTALGVVVGTGLMVPLPSDAVVLGSAFLRAFMEIGFAAVALATVSSASAPAQRGRRLSYVSSSRSLGYAIGAVGAGVLLESLAFSRSFLAVSVLPLVAGAVLFLLPHEGRQQRQERVSARAAFRSAGLTDLYVGTILRQMGTSGVYSLIYVYMASIHISPATMGLMSALNRISQVGAMVLFGLVVDRIGRRRVFMLGFALSVLVPLVVALSRGVTGMAVAFLLIGLTYSALYIGSTAHIGDRVAPEQLGTMLGLFETARGVGGLVGPTVAGAIASSIGLNGMMYVMAGICGVAVAVMVGHRRRGRPAADQASRGA